IGEISAGETRHEGMARRIFHDEAKFATALVEIKRAGLENRLLFAAIKIAEGDEIVEQLEKVAVVADKTVHGRNGIGLRFETFIFGNESRNRLAAVISKNLANTLEAEFFDGIAGFARRPAFITGKSGFDRRPIGFG